MVLVLDLSFYSTDPDGMGESINIFLFPVMSPSVGSEAAPLARSRGVILGRRALTSFAYTSLLLSKNQEEPVTSWEAVDNQLKPWVVLYHVFLVDAAVDPSTYKVCNIVKETAYIRKILWAQMQWQPILPASLLCLLQN